MAEHVMTFNDGVIAIIITIVLVEMRSRIPCPRVPTRTFSARFLYT